MIADAQAAYAFAAARVPAERIVVFGESLGTGVAVALAATQRIGAPHTGGAVLPRRRPIGLPVGFVEGPFRSCGSRGAASGCGRSCSVRLFSLDEGARSARIPSGIGLGSPRRFVVRAWRARFARNLVRRWVTPITACGAAARFPLDDRRVAAARPPDLHLFRPDRADRHPLRQRFRDVRDDRLHFRRGLFLLAPPRFSFRWSSARCSACWRCSQARWFRFAKNTSRRQRARAASLRTRWPSMAALWERLGRSITRPDQNV